MDKDIMTCGDKPTSASATHGKELDRLRHEHEAIARYRLYLIDPSKPRGRKKKYIQPFGLTLSQARAKCDTLNAELAQAGKARFMDPMYGIALENAWLCLSEAARQRMIAVGKNAKDFELQ